MYCTVNDLRENIGGLTETNTKAPKEFLTNLIERKCAHINSMIGRRYVLPINADDHTDAFNILKDICIELARPMVAIKLSVATGTDVDQKPENGMAADAERRLLEIKEGRYDLPGVELCTGCATFESGEYDNLEADGVPVEIRETQREIRQGIPR